MKNVTIITIKAKMPWEESKGHRSRRSGAGFHSDRRLKRQKTRSTQLAKALEG